MLTIIVIVITATINSLHQKYTVTKYGYKTHVLLKPLTSALLIPIFLQLKIELSFQALACLLAVSTMYCATTILTNMLLERIDMHVLLIILKVAIPISLIIDWIIGIIKINSPTALSILIFFIGIFFMFEMYKLNKVKSSIKFKDTLYITLMIIISIALPYTIKLGLNRNYFNSATSLISSCLFTVTYTAIVIRPKIKYTINLIANYVLQSTAAVANVILLYSLVASSVFVSTTVDTTSILTVTLLTPIFLKTTISRAKLIGCFIALAGFIGIQSFIGMR